MVHEIITEPAQNAEGTPVRHVFYFLDDVGCIALLKHVDLKGAAEAAVRTCREVPFNLPEPAFEGAQVFRKRTHGTDKKAFTAGDALFGPGWCHFCVDPGLNEVQDIPARYLSACVDTAQAKNASIFPVFYERRRVAIYLSLSCHRKIRLLDLVLEHQVLEVAFAARIANGAFKRMVCEEQLEVILPHSEKLV
ncbi:MAG: hypothetical protein A4E57_02554 [Syntrophorhabdaceae bacterium PtaU1.Bin034]|nr:MAG: hypothetical protein A4E57_02554 [Syntrophorhabdaceae bacterium PtaU1.Bin034]